jgi:hypothetical protein
MEVSAEAGLRNFVRQRAGIVGLVEEGEDLVAGLEAGDFVADGNDFASAIAARYGLWLDAERIFTLIAGMAWSADGARLMRIGAKVRGLTFAMIKSR